ncbi:MAG: hypothetical protein FWE44_00115 [Defluviitaleaceae bacterium]|nr:hypothetical protein [Defluviitaleaceae bacterium]
MAGTTKKQNRRNAILVTIPLLVLLAVGIFMVSRFVNSQPESRMVQIPAIHTYLSGSDGSRTIFGARVVLEVDSNTGNINTQQMYNEIRAAINSLSMDDVSGFDGTNIMREAVRDHISYHFAEGELISILFTDIVSDIPMQRDEPQRTNIIFDAIFAPR